MFYLSWFTKKDKSFQTLMKAVYEYLSYAHHSIADNTVDLYNDSFTCNVIYITPVSHEYKDKYL